LSEIVLYPGVDGARLHGAWRLQSDPKAAGGMEVIHPNAYAAKITAALAAPVHYFDLTFTADAGVDYHFYLRGKAQGNDPYNDSVFVQFSNTRWPPGTTTAQMVNLETCSGAGLSEWGWRDQQWCTTAAASAVRFAQGGPQTLRVQTREDGLAIDQLVLSATRTKPPGPAKNDQTIVSR
jgi:hypothetical protein